MSFDIRLVGSKTCPTCGHTTDPMDGRYAWDPTYNLSPMFMLAGMSREAFDGKTAAECAPIMRAGIDDMVANPDKYIALNSPNGWGVYGDDLLDMLRDILGQMEKHPYAIVEWR